MHRLTVYITNDQAARLARIQEVTCADWPDVKMAEFADQETRVQVAMSVCVDAMLARLEQCLLTPAACL